MSFVQMMTLLKGRNCGHICRGMWTLFLPIRFLWNWTIENPKNALWWHCWDRSSIRELLQCSMLCVMSNQRWHWFHTLQRTQCAAITTNVISSLGRVSSPLCVNELGLACSQTQLCQLGVFIDCVEQLHVSAWRWPIKAETCSCSTQSINTPNWHMSVCHKMSRAYFKIKKQFSWHTATNCLPSNDRRRYCSCKQNYSNPGH